MSDSRDSEIREYYSELRKDRPRLIAYAVLLAGLFTVSVFYGWRGFLPTWGDEAFTFRLAFTSWINSVFEIAGDVHPPLYFMFAKASVIFMEAGPRLLSYFLYIVLITQTIRLVKRRVRCVESTILASFILVSSAHLALFAPMLRYYGLSALAVTCATLFLMKPVNIPPTWDKKPRWDHSVWYAIFMWIAFASSYLTIVVIPAHIVYLLRHKKSAKPYWMAMVRLFIWSIPLLILAVIQLANATGSGMAGFAGILKGTIARLVFSCYSFLAGEFIQPWDLYLTIPLLIALLVLLFIVWCARKSPLVNLLATTFLITLPIGALALSILGIGLEFSASRLMFIAPMFLVLIGISVYEAGLKSPLRIAGVTAIVIILVINVLSTVNYSRGVEYIQSTYVIPWATIASDINGSVEEDDNFYIFYDDDTMYYRLGHETAGYEFGANLHLLDSNFEDGDLWPGDQALEGNFYIFVVYSPRLFEIGAIRGVLEEKIGAGLEVYREIEYVHEDETSMRWKSMLLGRPVEPVKKKLVMMRAVGETP